MRARRRTPPPEPGQITPGQALEYETTQWPSRRERFEFWSSAIVPPHLRQRAEPDPRVVLGGKRQGGAYKDALADWEYRRLQWLREVVNG